MEKLKKINQFLKQQSNQELLAKVALMIVLISTILQFIFIRQNSYSLDSVTIPKILIWEVNKQHILFAFILTLGNFTGLIFYFLKHYLWTVMTVLISLIVIRYVYIQPPQLDFYSSQQEYLTIPGATRKHQLQFFLLASVSA